MVHALHETWRVLKPGGFLIDLRPISIDVPLYVLTDDGWKTTGMPDQSPDRVLDLAADRAIRYLVGDGSLILVKRRYFTVSHYWNTLTALKQDVEEFWKEDVIISKEIWQQARQLYKSGHGKRRLRFPFRKKISLYQKVG